MSHDLQVNFGLKITVADYAACPRKSICMFIDYKSRSAYMLYSMNTFSFLITNLQHFKDGVHKYNALQQNLETVQFIILQSFDEYSGHAIGKYRLAHWLEYLTDRGYIILNKVKPLHVTPKVVLSSRPYKASVSLVTKRYEKIKVKEFQSITEAEDMINDNTVYDLLKIATRKN